MVRRVRMPQGFQEILREEPFFIGVVSVPDKSPEPPKPKQRRKPKSKFLSLPIKPAQPFESGDELESFDW